MPPPIEEKKEQKQGFLALPGMEVGQEVPLFKELGIPSRIGPEGEALWQIKPIDLFYLDREEPYRDYLWKKWDWILHAMFRGWNMLLRALDGNPSRLRYTWDVPFFPAPDHPNQVPTLLEQAPYEAQKMALASAYEYLKPQLEAQSHS